jgi:hypothetical protein
MYGEWWCELFADKTGMLVPSRISINYVCSHWYGMGTNTSLATTWSWRTCWTSSFNIIRRITEPFIRIKMPRSQGPISQDDGPACVESGGKTHSTDAFNSQSDDIDRRIHGEFSVS